SRRKRKGFVPGGAAGLQLRWGSPGDPWWVRLPLLSATDPLRSGQLEFHSAERAEVGRDPVPCLGQVRRRPCTGTDDLAGRHAAPRLGTFGDILGQRVERMPEDHTAHALAQFVTV